MRIRMKDPFDKATLLAPKIRAYVDLTRPFTLLAPFIGGILFGAMALLATDGLRLDRDTGFAIFYGAVTLAVVNAGSNAVNQCSDAEIDRVNKPYRPIPAGAVTQGEAESIGYLLWIGALLRSFMTNIPFFFLILAIIFCSYHYSQGAQLKKKYVWNNLTIAVSRGFLGPLAAWTTVGSPLNPAIIAVCLVFLVYTFGATVFKDLPDIEGDRKFGVKNFATQHSKWSAITVAGVGMLSSHIVLGFAVGYKVLPMVTGWYHINIVFTGVILVLAEGGKDADSTIENRWSWVLMYLQMMIMMFFFAGVFLVG